MLLVRTPAPYPTESLLGFVLRVSELNGYESQGEVLAAAGLSQDQKRKKLRLDLGKLAAILGRPVEELQHLAYSSPERAERNGLLLGQPVVARHLRLSKPRFCPQCVAENGFIEAMWDLAHVIACPRHRRELIGACPNCGKHFGNFRKGLLTCGCGASLLRKDLPTVPDEIAGLMGIIARKALSNPAEERYAKRLPAHELSQMSLRTLLVTISSLGWQQLASDGLPREDSISSHVIPASRVLRDWPKNFYSMMRRLGDMSASTTTHKTSFVRRHESLNGALFKKGLPAEEIRFIREAFIRYAKEEWRESFVRFKLPHEEGMEFERKLLSRGEIAKHLGVSPLTVSKLQRQGKLPIDRYETGRSSVLFAEKSKLGIAKAELGKSLGERDAARFLGLPISVLRHLRQTRVLEAKQLAIPLAAYHEADLKAFSEKVMKHALAPTLKDVVPVTFQGERDIVRLRDLHKRARFLSTKGAASPILALLDGRLLAVGSIGPTPGDLLVDMNDVRPLILESRRSALHHTISAAESAVLLHCDISVIYGLVGAGHLASITKPWGRRITEESLTKFSDSFVSLAFLAKTHEVSSNALIRICDRNGTPLLRVPRRIIEHPQPFLAREHEPEIARLVAAAPKRRKKQSN